LNYGVEINKLFNGNITGAALTLPPNAPALYDSAGHLNWEHSTFSNPLAAFKVTDDNRGSNLIISDNMRYELLSGLIAQVNLGYTVLNRNNIIKTDPFSAYDPALLPNNFTATSFFSYTSRSSWIIEPQLAYIKQLQQHELNILAGTSLQDSYSAYQMIRATGYSSDVLMQSLQGATKISYLRDDDLQYRYMAFFGRLGYNYKQKYIINITGRRDGSSRFGPDHRWGNFGSVGTAWIFSAEDFMKRFSFLSFGKLRTSYGVTGSDQVGDYQYLSTYKILDNTYQERVSMTPNGLANRDYAWEETRKLETALELSFLRNRISMEIAFYHNRCSNQLVSYPLPGFTGFTGVTQNLEATVQNMGWELSVNTINIARTKFQWTSDLNITLPRNKLVSYPGLAQSAYANYYVVGQPITISKVYRYIGVNPTTGLYEVKDIDGDGLFDWPDRTTIVNAGRHTYGGLTNTFRFKGIECSFLLQFAQLTSLNFKFGNLGQRNNVPLSVYESRWKKEGELAQFQKSSIGSSVSTPQFLANSSDAAWSDISFIRVKTLSMSYTFTRPWLDRFHLSAFKLYVQGQNLLTISNTTRPDPETGLGLPPLHMITCGVDVQF
jgi:TonB-linked SusC/RagA family outer membrane protein